MAKADQLLPPVREVLWTHWDPIGVNAGHPYGTKEADVWTDEYDQYGYRLVKLMLDGTDEATLTKRLGQLAKVSMGIAPNLARDTQVATLLLGLLVKET